jgi:tetratricopeptide (TPR) repeat protein
MKKIRTETEKLVELMQRASEARDTMKMLTSADEILRREPANVDAMFVAGTAMLHGGQEGLACILLNAARCATNDKIKLGAIWNNIGFALQNYQPEESYRAFKEALKYGDAPAGMYDNLCNVASQIGRHSEALDWAEKAGKGWDTAHNRAFAMLHLGRWDEAWTLYKSTAGNEEVRPKTSRSYDLPRWKGQKGCKLIIHGEQGVGDEIMFMSMVPADFDGVIECSPRMDGILQRSFPKAKVYGTLLQNYIEWPLVEKADYHIEMGGLGEYFAQEPFARSGFLTADPARCAAWRAWLAANESAQFSQRGSDSARRIGGESPHGRAQGVGRQKVGISWTGGTWATGRSKRTLSFDLASKIIADHPNVTWVNLEYEDRREELEAFPQVLNPHWATKKGADMDDLAALTASLDLIITATNSTADMAGALGVPTWALVPHNPPWRYSDAAAPASQDAMWFYESVRTFRQRGDEDGDWSNVIKRVSVALAQMQLKAAA